jgi:hypothetical protein
LRAPIHESLAGRSQVRKDSIATAEDYSPYLVR